MLILVTNFNFHVHFLRDSFEHIVCNFFYTLKVSFGKKKKKTLINAPFVKSNGGTTGEFQGIKPTGMPLIKALVGNPWVQYWLFIH